MRALVLAVLIAAIACSRPANENASRGTKPDSSWLALNVDSLPNDSLGVSVRRGRALLTATPESLPSYAPSALR